jgi:hypothetical protein
VIVVTTADRIDALLERGWAPTTVRVERGYVGRHRMTGFRVALTMQRLFYIARHRR